jgi:hypothetical protein
MFLRTSGVPAALALSWSPLILSLPCQACRGAGLLIGETAVGMCGQSSDYIGRARRVRA